MIATAQPVPYAYVWTPETDRLALHYRKASYDWLDDDSYNGLLSFVRENANCSRPQTEATDYLNNEMPSTETPNFINEKIRLLFKPKTFNQPEELLFAYDLKKKIVAKIEEHQFDKGVRFMLQTLKDALVADDYSKCDAFIQLLDSSISDFDLRLHVCVLTITSHWKPYLSARNSYYSSIEVFVNSRFEKVRARQILSGLE